MVNHVIDGEVAEIVQFVPHIRTRQLRASYELGLWVHLGGESTREHFFITTMVCYAYQSQAGEVKNMLRA